MANSQFSQRELKRVRRKKGFHKNKYKSGLENTFATLAKQHKVTFEYEPDRFEYVRPSHYTPDFKIAKGVYIETKGYLAPSDRQKLICFKEQYPHVKILICFGNSSNKLGSKSKTRYWEWAERNGFEWWDIRKGFPIHWFKKGA